MTEEKLKETRMKIAYNLLQGWAAGGIAIEDYKEEYVGYAYKVADEVLKQGGYNV